MLRFALAVLAVLVGFVCVAHAALSVRDDSGRTVSLAAPATRIVSLAPNLTELLFDIGAGTRIVGVIAHSDYPPRARRLPVVGREGTLELEAILALKPDLVLAWPSTANARMLKRLSALGVPVYRSQPRALAGIARTLLALGTLTGEREGAAAAALAFRARLERLRRRYARRPAVRVFYEVWDRPLLTVGGPAMISEVIRLCGGRNVFARLPELAPPIDREAVLRADPEAIVASDLDHDRPSWLDAWRAFPSLAAVARDNLFFVPAALIQRDTPRILDGAELLCHDLQRARAKRKANRKSSF